MSFPFAACGARPEPNFGVSEVRSGAPLSAAPSASASGSTSVWKHASSIASLVAVGPARFVSRGHWFGRYEAELRANALAASAYPSVVPGSVMAPGALLVEILRMRGVEQPVAVLAMERDANGWSYVEADARGSVQRSGRVELCVRCHAHVRDQDEVFGLPKSARTP